MALGLGTVFWENDGVFRVVRNYLRDPEGTTIYLVFRSVHGKLFDPVFVAREYHQIAGLVKIAGECKDSVFIGLPGLEEGSIVCRAAGVTWPADWNNGS